MLDKTILFFDTETSGMANFKSGYRSKQPWICQLGLILSNGKRDFTETSFLIRSNGRKISKEAKKCAWHI